MSEVMPLFANCILKDSFPRDLSEKEKKFIQEQYKLSIKNSENSTSSDWNILENEELKHLKSYIEAKLNEFLYEIINPLNKVEIYVTQSWINWTETGESHYKHNHPNSVLSGVFYLNANDKFDSIVFEKNETPFLFDFESESYNLYNAKTCKVLVKTGDIIIFGSNMNHYVKKSINPNIRISLAFNSMIKGKIHSKKTLNELSL